MVRQHDLPVPPRYTELSLGLGLTLRVFSPGAVRLVCQHDVPVPRRYAELSLGLGLTVRAHSLDAVLDPSPVLSEQVFCRVDGQYACCALYALLAPVARKPWLEVVCIPLPSPALQLGPACKPGLGAAPHLSFSLSLACWVDDG